MTLKDYLTKNNLRIDQFAERIGVSENHLYSLLMGRRNPSLPVAQKVYHLTTGQVGLLDWNNNKKGNDNVRTNAASGDFREVSDSNPDF